MDESAYWVGPANDPDRYRLTHLLGSGGEGEVWRAVRSGDSRGEVAIKIDAVPDAPDDGWARRFGSLTSLRVPGLVQVQEAFVGTVRHRTDEDSTGTATHRYVVMNHVEGITLRAWLDEHPDASPRQRLRILRRVASTLSSLHRGPGDEAPFTHGDVKPTNVIIGPDEKPVLVDLGLLRAAGAGPASGRTAAYSSPELRNPDATPSPRADTFSFAVTAMETLTSLTPPLGIDGALDLQATRTRISSAPELRLRPLVRRQLLRSLTPAPEKRPGTPARVFAGRTVVLTLVAVLVVLGAGGSAIAMRGSGASHRAPTAVGSVTPTPTVATTFPPPLVDPPTRGPAPTHGPGKSPSASPSGSASPSAPATLIDDGSILRGGFDSSISADIRSDCDTRSGAVVTYPNRTPALTSWGGARFSLTLSAKQDLRVLSVTRKPVPAPDPAKLYQRVGLTCPAISTPPVVSTPHPCKAGHVDTQYRTTTTYVADADAHAWREDPPKDHRPFGVLDDRCGPPSQLLLIADDCRTNVDYQVTVTYQLDGDPGHVYRRTFPPIHLRARVSHGVFLADLEGIFSYPFPFSGGPDHCADHGVRVTRPYASVTDGIYVVLVNQISTFRASHPGATTSDGIDAVIKALEQGGTRIVRAPYTAADLADVCRAAAANPSRWRGTCGPPDPSG